jgi:UPF0271 protein
MLTVDLNCDMGEGYPNDAELMDHVSSVNIACGFHAGDPGTMRKTVELALAKNVAIGAHPGYRDLEGFGRRSMSLTAKEVFTLIFDQVTALGEICARSGGRLHHVKPHGALYNQAATDRELAAAIAAAIGEFDNDAILYGLSGSRLIYEAEVAGLRTASEVFADRTYQKDGSLTPRSESNALIEDSDVAVNQVLQMIETESVTSVTGESVPIRADTICIHGDGPHAHEFAVKLRRRLEDRDVKIQAPFRNQ